MKFIFKIAGTKPPESMIRNSLCSGVGADQTNKIVNDFMPEAVRLYTDTTSSAPLPTRPMLYIKTLADKNLPSHLQAKIAESLIDAKITAINSGHLPMISHSSETASYISDFLNKL